jgi:RNA polymerase-binding transcription factor DksA
MVASFPKSSTAENPMSVQEGPFHGVPPRWRWHYDTLMDMRDRMMLQRERGVAQPIEHGAVNLADSATDEFNRDLALSRFSEHEDALYEVEAAMLRIEHGGYGLCERTGLPIPAERLRALPWTRYGCDTAAKSDVPHPPGLVTRTEV